MQRLKQGVGALLEDLWIKVAAQAGENVLVVRIAGHALILLHGDTLRSAT